MMEKFIIEGGKRLSGRVRVSGSKNASLPMMAASILTSDKVVLENVPRLDDVFTMMKLLKFMGCDVAFEENHRLYVDARELHVLKAPYELVKTMRASVLVLGPLLSRFHHAEISMPGGCAIGVRPINLHIDALKMMGADIKIEGGYIIGETRDGLHGCEIYLDVPTVTGTENIVMAATLARGRTVIKNAAREPEVVNLAEMLNKMGAEIEGAGGDTIEINGVDSLHGVEIRVIGDRIEAGTFMCVALATHSTIEIQDAPLFAMDATVDKFREAGGSIDEIGGGVIRVSGPDEVHPLRIKTMFYPGFPTDMQAQFVGVLVKAKGVSVVEETIFENRFQHVAELRRMGADISLFGNRAIINGVDRLTGAPVMATDLRASASLVIAGLSAEGITHVLRIYHLDRGYEALEKKLSMLGASIKREWYDPSSIT